MAVATLVWWKERQSMHLYLGISGQTILYIYWLASKGGSPLTLSV